MITEDYVSFETSILLKEKGFNEKCDRVYMHDGKCVCAPNFMEGESFVDNDDIETVKRYDESNWIDYIQGEYAYLCPSISRVMKWLREVHNLHCHSDYDYVLGWYCQITSLKETVLYDYEEMKHYHPEKDNGFSSPEEACEAAIKYCLENLI